MARDKSILNPDLNTPLIQDEEVTPPPPPPLSATTIRESVGSVGEMASMTYKQLDSALKPTVDIGWQCFQDPQGHLVYVDDSTGQQQSTCPPGFSPIPPFFTPHCGVTVCVAFAVFLGIGILSFVISLFLDSILGAFLLSTLPGISILLYIAEVKWRIHVLRMAVLMCFFEAAVYMVPCVLVELAITQLITGSWALHLNTTGGSISAIVQYGLSSFLGAGLVEEALYHTRTQP